MPSEGEPGRDAVLPPVTRKDWLAARVIEALNVDVALTVRASADASPRTALSSRRTLPLSTHKAYALVMVVDPACIGAPPIYVVAALVTVRTEPLVIVGAFRVKRLKPVAVVTPVAPDSVAVVAATLIPFQVAPAAEAMVLVGVNCTRPFVTFSAVPVVVPVPPVTCSTVPVVTAVPDRLATVPAVVELADTFSNAAFEVLV